MALLTGARRRETLVNDEVDRALRVETDRLARKSFYVWVRILVILTLLGLGLSALRSSAPRPEHNAGPTVSANIGAWLSTIGVFVLLGAGTLFIWRTKATARTVARIALGIILINGWTQTALFALIFPESLGSGALPSIELFLLACLAFPWGLRESVVPPLLLLPVHELVTAVAAPGALSKFGTGFLGAQTPAEGAVRAVAVHTALYAAGLVICALRDTWRRHRFRQSFISRRYGEVKGELAAARRLHESLFPSRGPLAQSRLDYHYEPLTEIGGDLLFALAVPGAQPSAPQRALVAVLDVTGHGIAAALTVQRIHREIERTLASEPCTGPGELLRHVNRFIYSTLSGHSMYGTMVVCRVDFAAGTLEYASAGHPPVLLVPADGDIRTLDSTAFVLGVARPESFDPAEAAVRIHPGDYLVLYTDGLIETMNSGRRALGVSGALDALRRAATTSQTLCRALADAAAAHRDGPPEDDLLIVCIGSTLGS